ncbi:hypothetical protein F4780DRAFT_782904 [Xylariomycetidae sp. FL0641]|nr:hypothetical protein F4780DRAFT_782904 [Xylariomycetidae sp. FL0641]
MKRTALSLAGLATACLLPEERHGGTLDRGPHLAARDTGKAIGTGDRFGGGAAYPRGLGSGNATDMGTILNVGEVRSGLLGLAREYPGGFATFTTPYPTYGGATLTGGKLGGPAGGDCDDAVAYRVFLNGGIHARERGSPDNLLYFAADLLWAERAGAGLRYGARAYTHAQVRAALGAGVVVLPLSNPDGVAYDQASHSCWRKNRNPSSAAGTTTDVVGVDLNRNFDFVWELERWAPGARGAVASADPRSEVYHGAAAFSEAEARGVRWVLDAFAAVRWFADLHAYAGDVLYSWGSDTDQSADAGMNFRNATYDAVRGLTSDGAYGEYVSAADLDAIAAVGARVGAAMAGAAGRPHTVQQSAYLYPTSGASDDYAFSRHFVNASLNRVHAYTIEFGFGNDQASCPFYPSDDQYITNMQEVGAGLMDFLLAAVEVGLGDPVVC